MLANALWLQYPMSTVTGKAQSDVSVRFTLSKQRPDVDEKQVSQIDAINTQRLKSMSQEQLVTVQITCVIEGSDLCEGVNVVHSCQQALVVVGFGHLVALLLGGQGSCCAELGGCFLVQD